MTATAARFATIPRWTTSILLVVMALTILAAALLYGGALLWFGSGCWAASAFLGAINTRNGRVQAREYNALIKEYGLDKAVTS